MSYVTCPHCGKRIDVFGASRVGRVAEEYGIPVLAQIPVTAPISELADAGHLEELTSPEIARLADAFVKAVDDATQGTPAQL
jgi:hypothetical protein